MAESYRSQLPAEFLQGDVRSALSWDAQAYFACDASGKEWRYNQTVNIGTPQFYRGRPCPDGDGGTLRLVIHAFRQEVICVECDYERIIELTAVSGDITCPRCGSLRYFPFSTGFDPPYPSTFGNLSLTTTRSHTWGMSAQDDADAMFTEIEGLSLRPDGPQYLIPAARFAAQLQFSNEYRDDDVWRIANVEAVLLSEYYRHTEEIEAGIDALKLIQDVADSPGHPLERAMLHHNVAMFAYSLVARSQPELEVEGGPEQFRWLGISAAESALGMYQEDDDAALPGVRIQIARVKHTLADLLKAGQATPDEIDEAIRLLDEAIAEPSLPENLKFASAQFPGRYPPRQGQRPERGPRP
jgi:hypothetical protein